MQGLIPSVSQLCLKETQIVVFHHPDTLLHRSTKKHPEQPDRVATIIDVLMKMPSVVIKELNSQEDICSSERVESLAAELQGARYLQFVQQMWDHGSKRTEMYINKDTYYCKDTYKSALAAAKTSIAAVQYAATETNAKSFAVVRPPGHHSGFKSQPHGFSFLNNTALAVHNILQKKKVSRVAIVDWDVHHGEGTQHIFYNRSDVLYISLHRFDKGKFFPHIPQSGSQYIGQSNGKGFNINICWNLPEKDSGTKREAEETVGDQQYRAAFQRIVVPVLKEFEPDLIVVSCGFDSGKGDPIGSLAVTSKGYQYMTQQLIILKKPLSFILEGGYSEDVLKWGSESVIKGLTARKSEINQLNCNQIGLEGIQTCLKHLTPYWQSLSKMSK